LSTAEAISAKPNLPLRLTADVNSAATQISGMYGMQIAVRMAAAAVSGENSAQRSADPMPSIVNPSIQGRTLRRTKFRKP